MRDLAYRLTGSSDLYQDDGRRPWASVNFVTAHDGFTLRDLVTHDQKHNQANGEDNADGTDDNRSWNCGVEGETDDQAINALRRRQRRNLLATIFISQGCPMVLHGDEIGRTQGGNNNAYCQDNETSWLHWEEADGEMVDFTRRLVAMRIEHPVLRRRHFFSGQEVLGSGRKDIGWYLPTGREVTDGEWFDERQRSLGMVLNGEEIPDRGPRGEAVIDTNLMVLMHAGDDEVRWLVPRGWGEQWSVVLDTAVDGELGPRSVGAGETVTLPGHSLLVLRRE